MNILIDYHSRTQIYEQIKKEIKLAISRGELKADDQLPSLRQLSSQLSININTLKRALSELESEGVTYSIAGKGIFVSDNTSARNFCKDIFDEISNCVKSAKAMGAKKEEITELIENIYKGDVKGD